MTFQLISDVHLEFMDNFYTFFDKLEKVSDNLIIAGDFITLVDDHIGAFNIACSKYAKVIYVLGNHEYYGSNKAKVVETCKTLSETYKNLCILNNEVVEIDGVKIGGTTLWFPDKPDNIFHERMLSDFKHIKNFRGWVYKENTNAVNFIKNSDMDILITHHLPSLKSTPERFKTSELNRFFVSDIEKILLDKNIKIVCHGHTHDSCEYKLDNGTQIYCNPYGYEGSHLNPLFKNNLVITYAKRYN